MRELIAEAGESREPQIGRDLWTLEEARRRTLRAVDGLFDPDWSPAPSVNTIGTLLYHIAAIELDWLYTEVRQEELPDEMLKWFQHDVRSEDGRLTPVLGETVGQHLDRLRWVRAQLLDTFNAMTLTDYRRGRELPHYTVTPEWVLRHLALHEASHAGQILTLRALSGAGFGESM